MPSPFPGMDPWLESPGLFPDLHQTLIAELRSALAQVIKPPYYTALGTRLYVDSSGRQIEPDVNVFAPKRTPAGRESSAAVATPLRLRIESDPVREWLVEIRHAGSGDRLVTSLELLSPSNKRRGSKGRRSYLKKRREVQRSRANVVEIDLLRAGEHTTLAPLGTAVRKVGAFEYHVCVLRYYRAGTAETYPIRWVDPLPIIAVPLLKGDPDARLDLQKPFERSYDIARFDQRADYANPAQPPLTPEQQTWAEGILKVKGVR